MINSTLTKLVIGTDSVRIGAVREGVTIKPTHTNGGTAHETLL